MTVDVTFLHSLLDSLVDPFVFVDTHHIIRYMNRTAVAHHKGGAGLLGSSIFDCHSEASNEVIRDLFDQMTQGLEERLITDNARHRIYMRAVRDAAGKLIGYYERYEPPVS